MFSFVSAPLARLFTSNAKWLEKQQTTIISAAAIITLANVISSISGLARQRLLISKFFNTQSSQEAFEAWLVAFQIPDMIFQLVILGALSAAFIPVFTALRKKSESQAFEMSAIVINILLVAFVTVSILVFIFAHPLTAWRTGEAFTQDQVVIAAQLTRIMLVAQLFFGISNLMSAILQSYQRFILPSIAPILYNLGIVAGVYLFHPWLDIYSAGVGVCLGAIAHMGIQLPLAWKLGFRFRWNFNINFIGVKKLFKLMPPRVATIGLSEVQSLGLGFFATSLGSLSFVVIRLASSLITIPIRLFGVPISQASLPFLAHQSDQPSLTRFRELVLRSLHQISFFALPASVLLLILRVPIVRLIFGTHNFPWTITVTTGKVVAIIALSIAAQAMVQLFIRAFYALKDTKTPFVITACVVTLYLAGSTWVVFGTNYGVLGLAGVVAVAAFFELFLFLILFNHKIKNFITSALWVPQLKMVAASFLMAVFLYLPFRILDEIIFDTTKTVELIGLTVVTSTIGMLVYVYFAALFEIKELNLVNQAIRSFGRWQKALSQTQEVISDSRAEDDGV